MKLGEVIFNEDSIRASRPWFMIFMSESPETLLINTLIEPQMLELTQVKTQVDKEAVLSGGL